MTPIESAVYEFADEDLEKIKSLATRQSYKQGSQLFSEGDSADYIYFIESGSIAISIQQFTHQEEVVKLGPGEYFGEMAFFSGDIRSATAVVSADATLLCVDKISFLALLDNDMVIAAKVNGILAKRNEELALKENLVDGLCIKSKKLQIGIKGDPSLRESAFTRERYESVVDKILPALQPHLYDLLMNRCVSELSIHFNSGEVHLRSIFNPLVDEIHPASKLINKAYIDRHFPLMTYQEKMGLAKRMCAFIDADAITSNLPQAQKDALCARHVAREPMPMAGISDIASRLPMLRKMQDFYLRNIKINLLEDSVRMQFNCDGAHIISSDSYQDFLNKNVPIDDDGETFVERRCASRRTVPVSVGANVDRRCPPGRRQEDWDKLTAALAEEQCIASE